MYDKTGNEVNTRKDKKAKKPPVCPADRDVFSVTYEADCEGERRIAQRHQVKPVDPKAHMKRLQVAILEAALVRPPLAPGVVERAKKRKKIGKAAAPASAAPLMLMPPTV